MSKVDLDHVAIALNDVNEMLGMLVGELGANILFGGANFGFRAMQVDCGGFRIELLEPWNVDQNDFLKRFLEANGEGPHHLTFKTDDIERELGRFIEAGYEPVGVNIDNPFWKEAFIHPKQAGNTVVQIAQSEMDPLDIERSIDPALIPAEMREYGPGQWWDEPPPRAATPATLRRVVVTTDEMARALGLYADLLGGERVGWGEGWVELGWAGPGKIRLEHAAGRPQGIDRLEWTYEQPATEIRVGGARFVLEPRTF